MPIHAADVVAFLDRLAIDRAVIVGHSMGSIIGQLVAAGHPDRLRGLVLARAFSGYRGKPVVQELVDAVLTPPIPSIRGSCGSSRRARSRGRAAVVPRRAPSRRASSSPARVWHAAFREMLALDPPPLSSIVAPTLILWGAQDTIDTTGWTRTN